jgi:CHAT domain-containing protein
MELLTLSACETAVGEQAALGLAGVAVKAGARSAVASLWLVDVESTVSLMKYFYSAICNPPNFSKEQALQQAQKQRLRDSGRYKHPYYRFFGDWKLVLKLLYYHRLHLGHHRFSLERV